MKALNFRLPVLVILAMFMFACQPDKMSPVDGDKTAPGPIINPEVTNGAGSATITYTLPNNTNLLYVKAVYETKDGVKQEARASYFSNSIVVEGFGDTKERDVTLYAVSRAEVESSPVVVKVKPNPAPVYDVFNTLDVNESFGGFNVSFTNPAAQNVFNVNKNIRIGVLRYDSTANEWSQIDMHYSGLPVGKFSVRGLEAKPTTFGFFIKDRYNNTTDTLIKSLVPVFEEALDVKKITKFTGKPIPQIAPLPLDGVSPVADAQDYSGSWPVAELFNDVYGGGDGYHSKEKVAQPIWLALDLKVKAKISRYKIWQRLHDNRDTYYYSHGNPHSWELWGTNNQNDASSWVLLDKRTMVKPSGLPVGINSNDDREIAEAGHEYECQNPNIAVRYIAWKNIDSWASINGNLGLFHMAEMKIWGQIED